MNHKLEEYVGIMNLNIHKYSCQSWSANWSHNQISAEAVLGATCGEGSVGPWLRSRRSTKWGPEYRINMVKEIWVNIAVH